MQIRPITESQINLIAKQCGFRGKLSKDLINTATTLSQILSNEGLSAHQHAFTLTATLANRLPKLVNSVDFCVALSNEFMASNLDVLCANPREK